MIVVQPLTPGGVGQDVHSTIVPGATTAARPVAPTAPPPGRRVTNIRCSWPPRRVGVALQHVAVIASSAANGSSIGRRPGLSVLVGARPARAHPLPHAARQRVALAALASSRTSGSSDSARSAARGGRRRRLQGQLHVAARREPRQQRRLLEHERRSCRAQVHLPVSLLQPGDEVEQRRLAAARRAQEERTTARRSAVSRNAVTASGPVPKVLPTSRNTTAGGAAARAGAPP